MSDEQPAAVATAEPSEMERSNVTTAPAAAQKRRLWPRLIIFLLLLAAIIAGSVDWWLQTRDWESTDDAFIDVRVTQVAPQVGGRVVRVLVNDNETVAAGQVLVELDPATFQASLDQALAQQASAAANLVQSKAQRAVDDVNAAQSLAQIDVARANAAVAAIQLKRDQEQVAAHAISAQQLDNSTANAESTAANLTAAQKKHAADEALLAVADSQIAAAQANLDSAAAQVEQARLNLSYTKISAAPDGRVARLNVSPGNYVQVGQNLMALVPTHVWVTANFKETQLDTMRVGQHVEMAIDAFPGKTFNGHVDSFQPGSGAAFSLLPPENATGNYVKVVQRVPVKIMFDDAPDPQLPLGPGMSVVPSVKVR
ncbi:HlyD family secretion protein [Methylovirgula sp. 4M-Z18]|uniref:HlyD family secretion protein n=1 Tax=Methylovirgula sp. 4M-Z18 TaxID=2293567 RepID=UPI000E2EA650|nr:HlyD family secretion protein [Methylovirgula sp. 4M-Z18]RFB78014.1 HlyD family secretion protein [Methylovirgula sp. 4M-Z18]